MKSIGEVTEIISPFVKKRESFKFTFEVENFREKDGFEKVIAETFEAVVDSIAFREERPKSLSDWSWREIFPSSVQRSFFFLKRRSLFDAVVERDCPRVKRLLESGFSEGAYFFSLEKIDQRLKLVGFCFRPGLISFNLAFTRADEPIINLFLQLRREEAVRSLTVDALSRVLYALYQRAETSGIESVTESVQFQTLFKFVRPSDLELILEREYVDKFSHLRCDLALSFSRILLDASLPEKWQRLKPRAPLVKRHVEVIARICKRDPSALSKVPKFVLESVSRARERQRVL